MINQDLLKERLVEEWLSLVDRNNGNTMTAMATQSPVLRDKLLNEIIRDSAMTADVQSRLAPLLNLETGKQRFTRILEVRKKYLSVRSEGLSLTSQAEHRDTDNFLSGKFLPVTEAYHQDLESLLAFQKQLIDDTHTRIRTSSRVTELLMVLFVVLGVSLGAVTAWYITRILPDR
ncbi:MCP four helix bundle domain-containing protein [Pantoea sp. App145]|uniref:MCP four helix bundle domain-containing protein n=1 Tax=Pantoea sp. App145 TaxID=3071567 RepID=UPI003A80F929